LTPGPREPWKIAAAAGDFQRLIVALLGQSHIQRLYHSPATH
jgi:hypothetical protein